MFCQKVFEVIPFTCIGWIWSTKGWINLWWNWIGCFLPIACIVVDCKHFKYSLTIQLVDRLFSKHGRFWILQFPLFLWWRYQISYTKSLEWFDFSMVLCLEDLYIFPIFVVLHSFWFIALIGTGLIDWKRWNLFHKFSNDWDTDKKSEAIPKWNWLEFFRNEIEIFFSDSTCGI